VIGGYNPNASTFESISARAAAPRSAPVARKGRLRGWGRLKKLAAGVDAAFTPTVDVEITRMLERRS